MCTYAEKRPDMWVSWPDCGWSEYVAKNSGREERGLGCPPSQNGARCCHYWSSNPFPLAALGDPAGVKGALTAQPPLYGLPFWLTADGPSFTYIPTASLEPRRTNIQIYVPRPRRSWLELCSCCDRLDYMGQPLFLSNWVSPIHAGGPVAESNPPTVVLCGIPLQAHRVRSHRARPLCMGKGLLRISFHLQKSV